jgi:hypothetical protein
MDALASQRLLLTRLMLLSVAAGLATIALKLLAWRLTGSTGLFGDVQGISDPSGLFAAWPSERLRNRGSGPACREA